MSESSGDMSALIHKESLVIVEKYCEVLDSWPEGEEELISVLKVRARMYALEAAEFLVATGANVTGMYVAGFVTGYMQGKMT